MYVRAPALSWPFSPPASTPPPVPSDPPEAPAASVPLPLAVAVRRLREQRDLPEAQLATAICNEIAYMSPEDIRPFIQRHLQRMQLVREDGTWVDPRLQVDLTHVSAHQLQTLVWQMAACEWQNADMHRALLAAAPAIMGISRSDRREMIRDVVTFAFTLETLTRAYSEQADAVSALYDLGAQPLGVLGQMRAHGILYGDKFSLVREAVGGMADTMRTGDVEPDAFHSLLQDNINVMTAIDDPANNAAALVLSSRAAAHADGHDADPATYDGHVIRMHYLADTRAWVDLYSSWNMALGMQTDVAPYFATKLLIPSVGDYAGDPEAFMHHRVVALYLFMLWHAQPSTFRDGQPIEWSLPDVGHAMAVENEHSAQTVDAQARADGYGDGASQSGVRTLVGLWDWARQQFRR